MQRKTAIFIAGTALAVIACAQDPARFSSRGEPASVNSYPGNAPHDVKSSSVLGVSGPAIQPSPAAMATTGSAGSTVDTTASTNAGMGTSGSTSTNGSATANR